MSSMRNGHFASIANFLNFRELKCYLVGTDKYINADPAPPTPLGTSEVNSTFQCLPRYITAQ